MGQGLGGPCHCACQDTRPRYQTPQPHTPTQPLNPRRTLLPSNPTPETALTLYDTPTGSRGIYFGTIDIETGAPAIVHFPANIVPAHAIANTTGAGDSFAGGFVCAASREWPLDQAVALGQAAASLALYSHSPVSPVFAG